MLPATKKWIFLRISSLILLPLMFWFVINLVNFYDKTYLEIVGFLTAQPSKILIGLFLVFSYFFSALSISEVFEDNIKDEKIKNAANKALNFFAITLICFWFAFMLLGETNYQIIKNFLETFLGKFILIGITWSFSFQMLSEIRHLIMDYGYGFKLQTTKVTGLFVIFGSIILTILIYFLGRSFV